jgi:hypothetical protein
MAVSQRFIDLLNMPMPALRKLAKDREADLPPGGAAGKWDLAKAVARTGTRDELEADSDGFLYADSTAMSLVPTGARSRRRGGRERPDRRRGVLSARRAAALGRGQGRPRCRAAGSGHHSASEMTSDIPATPRAAPPTARAQMPFCAPGSLELFNHLISVQARKLLSAAMQVRRARSHEAPPGLPTGRSRQPHSHTPSR